MINQKLLAKLQANQYTIKSVGGKNQVYKTSATGRLTKKVGKIYDNGSGVCPLEVSFRVKIQQQQTTIRKNNEL